MISKCLQQYNLLLREVGKGGRGGRKGMESEWSRQTCQLHITPAFKTFSSGKVIIRRIKLNIRTVN